ncbi:hypothetical protein CHELA40_14314 [Chelatococcus asaccharovorans]|nr:hypothetical protein CHELA17_61307 [Chelatococcus asaccharovorans]CAH1676669.1 hypothetical protein CHELA40_14314 [Chelatococcus asaccharovorans]
MRASAYLGDCEKLPPPQSLNHSCHSHVGILQALPRGSKFLVHIVENIRGRYYKFAPSIGHSFGIQLIASPSKLRLFTRKYPINFLLGDCCFDQNVENIPVLRAITRGIKLLDGCTSILNLLAAPMKPLKFPTGNNSRLKHTRESSEQLHRGLKCRYQFEKVFFPFFDLGADLHGSLSSVDFDRPVHRSCRYPCGSHSKERRTNTGRSLQPGRHHLLVGAEKFLLSTRGEKPEKNKRQHNNRRDDDCQPEGCIRQTVNRGVVLTHESKLSATCDMSNGGTA